MPHLTIEYSDNLPGFDPRVALTHVNQMLDASGLFQEIDIKSRIIACPVFQVGLADSGRGFIHARIAIMPGRTDQQKADLTQAVLHALRQQLPTLPELHVQISVELTELDASSYAKDSVLGGVSIGR
jgi:5-carboxymethyl-2-hydroxymuconate isomerase